MNLQGYAISIEANWQETEPWKRADPPRAPGKRAYRRGTAKDYRPDTACPHEVAALLRRWPRR